MLGTGVASPMPGGKKERRERERKEEKATMQIVRTERNSKCGIALMGSSRMKDDRFYWLPLDILSRVRYRSMDVPT